MSEKNPFENREQLEPETIEVNQFEWKLATPPHSIETTGMGPCVGVIVYDPALKKAMCGHYPSPERYLDNMLDETVKNFPDKSRLKVYVGGGSPSGDDQPYTATKKTREYVKKALASYGFQNSQISIKWTDSSWESTIMRIDPAIGEVEYEQEEHEDEDD